MKVINLLGNLFEEPLPYDDLIVLWWKGALPPVPFPELLRHTENMRFGIVFVTEDNLDDPDIVREKVNFFLNMYGTDWHKVKVVVMIAKDPMDKWGSGFPYKMRISVFPRGTFDLYTP